jgi:hypothetical protein
MRSAARMLHSGKRISNPSSTLGAFERFRNPHKTWILGCQNRKV